MQVVKTVFHPFYPAFIFIHRMAMRFDGAKVKKRHVVRMKWQPISCSSYEHGIICMPYNYTYSCTAYRYIPINLENADTESAHTFMHRYDDYSSNTGRQVIYTIHHTPTFTWWKCLWANVTMVYCRIVEMRHSHVGSGYVVMQSTHSPASYKYYVTLHTGQTHENTIVSMPGKVVLVRACLNETLGRCLGNALGFQQLTSIQGMKTTYILPRMVGR